MRTARVIITRECRRQCEYCCDNPANPVVQQAKRITSLQEIAGYDQYVLTGGEPMLNWAQTRRIITKARMISIGKLSVILYTAWWPEAAEGNDAIEVLKGIEGFTYTLHHPFTQGDALALQRVSVALQRVRVPSTRLVVHPTIDIVGRFGTSLWNTGLWDEIRTMQIKPADDCPIGANEELFIYEE